MPARSAHTAAASLRAAYGCLQGGAALSGGAALGLLPFLAVLPIPGWQTAGLLLLAVAYSGRKAYQCMRARRAKQQLRLEERFLRQPLEARQLVRCLGQRRHLWARSYAVRVLRKLLTRPLPHLLLANRKKAQLRERYRRTLASVQPAPFSLDLFLGLALLGLAGAAALQAGVLDAAVLDAPPSLAHLRLFHAGLLAGPLLLLAELFQTACRRRARRAFQQLTRALTTWTLACGVDELLRPERRASAAYRHTLLYRTPSWFGSPASGALEASPESRRSPE